MAAHHLAPDTRRNRLGSAGPPTRRRGSARRARLARFDRTDVLRITRGLLSHHLVDGHQLSVALLPRSLALLAVGDGDLVARSSFVRGACEQLAGYEQQQLIVLEARL